MELKINEYQLPAQIEFNFEELKAELTEKVKHYETMVYSDDQIREAKTDKANLNKLKKALNDERIRREREYLEPFNKFKAQVNEIIGIIDKPINVIDKQVKEFDEIKKKEKKKEIEKYLEDKKKEGVAPDYLTLDKIFEERWLNASLSLKNVYESIDAWIVKVENDMNMLRNLPEFGFEASKVYEQTLDVNKAVSEAQKMSQIAKEKAEAEKRKAEEEAKRAEVPQEETQIVGQTEFNNAEEFESVVSQAKEPSRSWVTFRANLTTDDALALKAFFESRNIKFEKA